MSRAAALLSAAVVLAVAGPAAEAQAPPDAPLRMDGEYGLWVREADGRVVARWITADTVPGRLEVVVDGRTAVRLSTEAGRTHRAEFPLPEGPEGFLLRYGAAGSTLHETRVRLPLDPPRPGATFGAPDSIYVVGDVHGRYRRLRTLLSHVGLVDGDGRWTGGRAHLVLLGDLTDRGPDVTRTLWWLYGLEERARGGGGRLHVVLGNHELMDWLADLRYVHPKELRLAFLHGVTYDRLLDVRTSVLGRWLASKPPVLELGDLLFAHGGVSPAYAEWPVRAFDDSLGAWIREPLFRRLSDSTVALPPMDSAAVARRLDFFLNSDTPFWYRGWFPPEAYGAPAASDTASEAEESDGREGDAGEAGPGGGRAAAAAARAARLEAVLERYGASRHVVAHTPLERVTSMYGGKLLTTDLRDAATELLLLVHGDGRWRPYRWSAEGDPEPLE